MKRQITILIVFLFAVNSCNIEKRLYRPGFFVHRKSHVFQPVVSSQEDKKSSEKHENVVPIIPIIEERDQSTVSSQKIIRNKQLTTSYNKNKHSRKATELNYLATNYANKITNIPPKTRGFEQPINGLSLTKAKDEKQNSDGLVYLTASLMALAALGAFRYNRKNLMQLTRWARENPKKARLLIAGLQLPILGLAAYSGYNLKEMGYEISSYQKYVLSATLMAGFLMVPFRRAKPNSILLPTTMLKNRIGYLSIIVSSHMLTTGYVNEQAWNNSDSYIVNTMASIDENVFMNDAAQNLSNQDNYEETNIKKYNYQKRIILSTGVCILAIFLSILLLATLCAGVCLIIFAVSGDIAAGLGVLGLFIAILSVLGIKKSLEMC